MERRQLIILTLGTISVLIAGSLALAQVGRPPRPVPLETPLTPSREAVAALAEARQNPLTARLQAALGSDPDGRRLLGQIMELRVPVIGPPDPRLLRTARFHPDDRQYTMVVRPPGQIIEIFGSTRAFRPPEGVTLPPLPSPPTAPPATTRAPPANPLAAALAQGRARGLRDIRTERTEYGVDVTFGLFGAAYNISLICDDRGAASCSESAAVQFATRLELIGGGR